MTGFTFDSQRSSTDSLFGIASAVPRGTIESDGETHWATCEGEDGAYDDEDDGDENAWWEYEDESDFDEDDVRRGVNELAADPEAEGGESDSDEEDVDELASDM